MKTAGGLNRLRLLEVNGWHAAPAGVIVSGTPVAPLAKRLEKRTRHYTSLRVTFLRGQLIFWSVANEVELPWVEEEPIYLAHMEKTVFFPASQRPDLPAGWIEPIIGQLASQKELSRPVLLLPSDHGLQAIGLGGNSCPVHAVDWEGIAGS